MKNIVVIPNPLKDNNLIVTVNLVEKLKSLGLSVFIHEKYRQEELLVNYYNDFPTDAELIAVVGGDGSIIDASKYAIENSLPIIGVNMGRVGYLSEVDPGAFDILERLISGEYFIKEKMLLTVSSEGETALAYAVNDVIVSHGDYLGISEFSVSDSLGNYLDYRADGVVFATPQGSTAYSFSSGGPVLAHDVDGILVTPVCPHSFFNRSILFNANESLVVENKGTREMNVAIDGRLGFKLSPGGSCKVTKSDKKIKMLTFSENNMFTELFKKMSITEGIK